MPVRRSVLLAVPAGILVTLGLPPFGWWVLPVAGIALVAHAIDDKQPRERAWIGLAFGVAFVAPGLFWMTEFSLPGWVLAMLLESLFVGAALVVTPRRGWLALTLPSAFVLSDAFRGAWPWGGVPIATVGQTQIGGPLLHVARLGGVLAITGLLVAAGLALDAAVRRRWITAASTAAAVVAVTLLGAIAPDGRHDGSLRVAAVQGGGKRGTRAIETSEAKVFQAHVRASADVPAGVDLILWPEDVIDVDTHDVHDTPEARTMSKIAADHGATVVAGVVSGASDEPFFNVAQVWKPDGTPGGRYEKNQRVPFGEWIPFRSIVDRVADLSAVPRDAHAGHGPAVVRVANDPTGVLISYEVFFARRARSALQRGAGVLLVPTNASSYSTTQMPALEVGAARLRAVETGRDLMQAAPTGFTAFIDHRGRVRAHTDLGARAVLTATLERRTGRTIYTRVGDGPFVLAAILVLGMSWWLTRRRSG
jgi:apolipoprotein N-acyltransferase